MRRTLTSSSFQNIFNLDVIEEFSIIVVYDCSNFALVAPLRDVLDLLLPQKFQDILLCFTLLFALVDPLRNFVYVCFLEWFRSSESSRLMNLIFMNCRNIGYPSDYQGEVQSAFTSALWLVKRAVKRIIKNVFGRI